MTGRVAEVWMAGEMGGERGEGEADEQGEGRGVEFFVVTFPVV